MESSIWSKTKKQVQQCQFLKLLVILLDLHPKNGKLRNIFNNEISLLRQDLPPAYILNGALYLVSKNFLETKRTLKDESTLAYVMPRHRSVDIDDIDDWHFAEYLIKQNSQ